jgi:hypothetical protein
MKRAIVFLVAGAVCLGASWAAFQGSAAEEPAYSRFFPAGALLYLQAKDFSGLLSDWNGSAQKQQWLKSANYEVFSRSRLLLRLKGASSEFAAAAGLPAEMNFLGQIAGGQSSLALYDIGKLQFLYITRLSSANSMQSGLWETRSKFETRSAGGVSFYYRRDPESEAEVAFAVAGDHFVLGTREDLVAGALQLMAGSKDRSIEAEQWWSQSVAAAGPAGDLRLVLNLEKIVPSPYFRSYWVQQNITEMKQYSAAVSDLFRSRKEYREERVLVKKSPSAEEATADTGAAAVADLVRFVPAQAGIYEVKANPSAADCFSILETKILAPHLGPAAAEQLAPEVQLMKGETGNGSDLETRIDQAPVQRAAVSADLSTPLKDVFEKNRVRAILRLQSSERDKGGVFVRIHSTVALLGDSDWNEAGVRSELADFLRHGLTAGQLGVDWQTRSGSQELNGLMPLAMTVRGKYLFISDAPAALEGMIANMKQKTVLKPALFAAGFDHGNERQNFVHLTSLLDRSGAEPGVSSGAGHFPEFFSENMASLSTTLAGVSSERIVIRDGGDKVLQTVTYEWDR